MTSIIPINVDRNVSFRDYRDIEGKALRIADRGLFHTFQGEGPFSGVPCVFLRLAGCNLGAKEDCAWCDTKFEFDTGKVVGIEETMARIKSLAKESHLLVVTGGEPLLQHTSLEALSNLCYKENFLMQLETNGYFVKEHTLLGQEIVVSPKIPHNRVSYLPFKPEWAARRVSLKYVVTADQKSPYHFLPMDVLENRSKFKNVYVSGVCVYKRSVRPGETANVWDTTLVDQEATAANYKYAASLALQWNLKVSFQTHLFGMCE